jgi:hypothetical protein
LRDGGGSPFRRRSSKGDGLLGVHSQQNQRQKGNQGA